MTGLFADWRYGILLVLVFSLPVLLGDVGTVLIMIMAALVAVSAVPRFCSHHRPVPLPVWLFTCSFVLMAIALIASAREATDARFVLNFAPLLLAAPLAVAEANERPQASLNHIAILSAIGAALSLAIACVQVFVFAEARAGEHVINAIHFANIALTLGFMALVGIFTSASKWRYLLLLGPICAIVSCVLSASRGPLVGALVLFAIFFAILWFRSRRSTLLILGAGLIVGAVLFAAASAFAPTQLGRLSNAAAVIMETLMEGETGDRSTNIRLGLFAGGWAAFQDSIWIGHGWDRIIAASHPYLEPWLQDFLDARNFTYLHNDVLDFAAGAGILGVLAYLLMMVAPTIGVIVGPRDDLFLGRLYGALVLTVGFFVFGLTSRLMGHALQLTLFCMMSMVINSYGRRGAAGHAP